MARKKGRPAYANKKVLSSYCVDRSTWLAMSAAEKRTGKSKSDLIQHCLLTGDTVDSVTRDTMTKLAESENAAA